MSRNFMVSPKKTRKKHTIAHLIGLHTVKEIMKTLYPKTSMNIRDGDRRVTLQITTNPPAGLRSSLTNLLTNEFNLPLDVSKPELQKNNNKLLQYVYKVEGIPVYAKINFKVKGIGGNGRPTCYDVGDRRKYTQCLKRKGKQTMGVDNCDDEPTCAGTEDGEPDETFL